MVTSIARSPRTLARPLLANRAGGMVRFVTCGIWLDAAFKPLHWHLPLAGVGRVLRAPWQLAARTARINNFKLKVTVRKRDSIRASMAAL